MQPYTLLFYCGRDDPEPFLRRPSFASDDEAIRETEALLLRMRDLKPATVTLIAVGRFVDPSEEADEPTEWLGSWVWEGAPRWEPEVPNR